MHACGQIDIVETTYLPTAGALLRPGELGCRTRCNVKAYDVELCTGPTSLNSQALFPESCQDGE
jgi:hypothetical protein